METLRVKLLEILKKLLKDQLSELAFRVESDFPHLKGHISTASPTEQAIKLIEFLEQSGKLPYLADLLKTQFEIQIEVPLNAGGYDIFVSYHDADNQCPTGQGDGWVDSLIINLKSRLNQKFGAMNACIIGPIAKHAVASDNSHLKNAKLLLLLWSSAYAASPECLLELETFWEAASRDKRRLVVVEQDTGPEKREELAGARTYRFTEAEYFAKLGDLTEHLYAALQPTPAASAQAAPPPDATAQHDAQPTVFLALPSEDLEDKYAEIKRFLTQQAIRVLPEKPELHLPELQRSLSEDLPRCDLFVQLLSDKWGHGIPLLQYERATQNKTQNELTILQWRDKSLALHTVQDETRRTLLSGKAVIASPLEEFKDLIIRRLGSDRQPSPRPKGNYLVFINAAPKSMRLVLEIKAFLTAENIGVGTPFEDLNEVTATEIQKYQQQQLSCCDAVIIIYDERTPVTWATEQILECHKMRGLRDTPFKAIALYDKPDAEKQSLPVTLPYVLKLNCPELHTATCLPEFIRSLTS